MISDATERKYCIRRNSTLSVPNVVYMIYCKKCKKQGVGSTVSRKPRLGNVCFCKIATHFIDEHCDEKMPFKYLEVVLD